MITLPVPAPIPTHQGTGALAEDVPEDVAVAPAPGVFPVGNLVGIIVEVLRRKLVDLADLEAARTAPPLDRSALQGSSAAVLLDSMLIRRAGDYLVLMPLRASGEGPQGDVIDVERVSNALQQAGL